MDFIDYVMVLASVIVGPRRRAPAPGRREDGSGARAHQALLGAPAWIVLMFDNALFWWWWDRPVPVGQWTFELTFVLDFAVLLYSSAQCSCRRASAATPTTALIIRRRRWLFGLMLLFSLFDLVDSDQGLGAPSSLGWPY